MKKKKHNKKVIAHFLLSKWSAVLPTVGTGERFVSKYLETYETSFSVTKNAKKCHIRGKIF